jgi:hypothetical protein
MPQRMKEYASLRVLVALSSVILSECGCSFERGKEAVKLDKCAVNLFQNFLFPKVTQLSLYYIVCLPQSSLAPLLGNFGLSYLNWCNCSCQFQWLIDTKA